MRVWNWIKRLFAAYRKPDTSMELIAALAKSQAALTERLEVIQNRMSETDASVAKQFTDIRAIIIVQAEVANKKPIQARNFREMQNFMETD